MAILTAPFKPIVEALDDLEVAAAQVVLAASEEAGAPSDELGRTIHQLATALWELQESRARARAIAAEVGTPSLHVIEL